MIFYLEVKCVTYEEMNVFRFIIAVATACMEDERPRADAFTCERACSYVGGILDIALSRFGIDFSVRPMKYPVCCKIPIIITLDGLGERLFWFHPSSDTGALAAELEGVLHDAVQQTILIPALGGAFR